MTESPGDFGTGYGSAGSQRYPQASRGSPPAGTAPALIPPDFLSNDPPNALVSYGGGSQGEKRTVVVVLALPPCVTIFRVGSPYIYYYPLAPLSSILVALVRRQCHIPRPDLDKPTVVILIIA